MNLGAEPKKVIFLAGLVVVAIGGLYFNSTSDTPAPTPTRRPGTTATSVIAPPAKQTRRVAGRPQNTEFKPRVLGSRPDDKVDVNSIEPELRLDILAKVEAVPPITAGRNLFQFGKPPAPPTPIPAVPPTPIIPINNHPVPPPQPVVTGPPPPPPPTPINLKYYGYIISKSDGGKRGFLLDGDDILMVSENQTVKQRYRIVKIAQTTIDIEDVPAKNTQTLRMPPDAPS